MADPAPTTPFNPDEVLSLANRERILKLLGDTPNGARFVMGLNETYFKFLLERIAGPFQTINARGDLNDYVTAKLDKVEEVAMEAALKQQEQDRLDALDPLRRAH